MCAVDPPRIDIAFLMILRAIVQDGLIIVNTHGEIPDGTQVEIVLPNPRKKSKKSAPARRGSPKPSKSQRGRSAPTPGFGMWADRQELEPSAEAVDRLRTLTRRRRVG